MSEEHATGVNTYEISLSPPSPFAVTSWSVIAAVHGAGSLLLGPHRDGAQAIVPPGVLVPTPSTDHCAEFDNEGWRRLIWHFQTGDGQAKDARRPASLRHISGREAIAEVRRLVPDHDRWLRAQLKQQSQAILLLLDYDALDADELAALRAELDDLLLDCVDVYGESWVKANLAPGSIELPAEKEARPRSFELRAEEDASRGPRRRRAPH